MSCTFYLQPLDLIGWAHLHKQGAISANANETEANLKGYNGNRPCIKYETNPEANAKLQSKRESTCENKGESKCESIGKSNIENTKANAKANVKAKAKANTNAHTKANAGANV